MTTLMIEEKKISRGGKQILGGKKDQMEPQEKNSFFGEKMVRRNHATRQKKRKRDVKATAVFSKTLQPSLLSNGAKRKKERKCDNQPDDGKKRKKMRQPTKIGRAHV